MVTDANEYISYLDSLRRMGQEEARVAAALRSREKAVFDHTSDLDALHNQVIAMRIAANNRPTIADANSYISHLDQLRAMGSTSPTDANAFISHLDRLRQQGLNASEVSSTQFVSR